jgi:hypothetical protein
VRSDADVNARIHDVDNLNDGSCFNTTDTFLGGGVGGHNWQSGDVVARVEDDIGGIKRNQFCSARIEYLYYDFDTEEATLHTLFRHSNPLPGRCRHNWPELSLWRAGPCAIEIEGPQLN